MKKIKILIVILSVILAAGIGLLVYLELDRRGAGKVEDTLPSGQTQTQSQSQTEDPDDPLATQAPAFTFETEGQGDATPVTPVQGVDPMDPQGATEGPQVDPTLGAGETVDPTENELPIVEG